MMDLIATNQPFHSRERTEQRLRDEIARLKTEVASLRREMGKAWRGLQTASPWSESNDMLWGDEMLCGIHLLLARAQRAESERNSDA